MKGRMHVHVHARGKKNTGIGEMGIRKACVHANGGALNKKGKLRWRRGKGKKRD